MEVIQQMNYSAVIPEVQVSIRYFSYLYYLICILPDIYIYVYIYKFTADLR